MARGEQELTESVATIRWIIQWEYCYPEMHYPDEANVSLGKYFYFDEVLLQESVATGFV